MFHATFSGTGVVSLVCSSMSYETICKNKAAITTRCLFPLRFHWWNNQTMDSFRSNHLSFLQNALSALVIILTDVSLNNLKRMTSPFSKTHFDITFPPRPKLFKCVSLSIQELENIFSMFLANFSLCVYIANHLNSICFSHWPLQVQPLHSWNMFQCLAW